MSSASLFGGLFVFVLDIHLASQTIFIHYFKKTGWNLRWFNCFTVVHRPNHKLQDESAPGRLSWKLHSWRMILVTPTSRLSLLFFFNYPIIMVLRNTEFISFKANMCLMLLALVCYLQLHIATIHLFCSMRSIILGEASLDWMNTSGLFACVHFAQMHPHIAPTTLVKSKTC